jgi:hypothetical protein
MFEKVVERNVPHYLNTLDCDAFSAVSGDTSLEPTDRGWGVFRNFGT